MRDAARHAAPAPPERPGAAGDPGAASPERVVSELAATLFARGLDDAAAAAAVADAAQRALGADRATCYTISADRTVGSVHTTETDPARRAAITAARGRGPHDAPIWRLTIGCPDPVLAVPDAGRHPGVPAGLARALGVGAFSGPAPGRPGGRAGRARLHLRHVGPTPAHRRPRAGRLPRPGRGGGARAGRGAPARPHPGRPAPGASRPGGPGAGPADRDIGSWRWRPATGELWWSPECYRIAGRDPELGTDRDAFLALVHPDDRAQVEDAVAGHLHPPGECSLTRARREGRPVRVEEDVFLRSDGSPLPVAHVSAPFATAAGDRGWVVVVSDISERRAREERMRRDIESLTWVGRVRRALAEDRFTLHAQPIVEVAGGRVVQHELLVRMEDEDGGIIPPGRFLPAAEEHGLIADVDRWVVRAAVALLRAGHPVQVNLSAASVGDPGACADIERRIRAAGVDPSLLVLEITETTILRDEAAARGFVERVRELGCRVALDDFGSGYGGFRYLKHLPVDFLKVDGEFVRDLRANPASRHVVEAVVSLARAFGQRTVAEGVEDRETLALLEEIGVELAQGYALGRPAPAEAALAAAAAGR